ncbi:MAG: hypothetical protein QQW96_03700 [Tychonema bourrellyi B0820]|nr:hypothetical protein [Tychonema bourrellyi B0820]PJE45253.1 MAG: hypothetical protein CUR32_01235 [Flavobacterium sp.] [Flavobacterium sp. FEMGT703F]
MESNGALCPHLITHIDPAIESLMLEKLGISFSNINQMTVEGFQEFGQLGIQAQWLLDNIQLIEKIYGQVIDSNVAWNKAVAAVTKKGFSAIEGFDKQAVDVAISVKRRASKLLEGQDRLANADLLHSQLRSDNNEKDRIRIGVRLAQSLAELEQARADAASEPAIQAAMAAWKANLGNQAKQAKLALQYGYDASSHPKWGGTGQSGYSQPQFSGGYQPRQIGGSPKDAINFNWSGNMASSAKNFMGNIRNGFKKISKFFGGN